MKNFTSNSIYVLSILFAIFSLLFFCCTNTSQQEEIFIPHVKTRLAVVLNDRMGKETSLICEKELSNNWFVVDNFPEEVFEDENSTKKEILTIKKSDLLSSKTLTKLIVPDFSIRVIHYPDDFTRAGITRTGDIRKILNDKIINSVIFLDPQTRTDAYLSKIREERPSIKFYCLMPTESVLAMEAWSDLVLSFSLPTESGKEENIEEEDTTIDAIQMSKALKILCFIAKDNINKPQEQNSVQKATSQKLSVVEDKLKVFSETANWKCGWHIDSDSGLRSQNHIVVTP